MATSASPAPSVALPPRPVETLPLMPTPPSGPLTFRLAEAIFPSTLTLERAVLHTHRAQARRDLIAGADLAKLEASDRDAYLQKQAEAQREVSEDQFVEAVRAVAKGSGQAFDKGTYEKETKREAEAAAKAKKS